MLLASSICSFISAQELSGVTTIIEQRTFRSFESYIVATLIYLALALGLKVVLFGIGRLARSEEHTSELQSLMRISYAVFCLKKKTRRYWNATPRSYACRKTKQNRSAHKTLH